MARVKKAQPKRHVVAVDFDRWDALNTYRHLVRMAAATHREPGDLVFVLLERILPAWRKAKNRYARTYGADENGFVDRLVDPAADYFLETVALWANDRGALPPRQPRRIRAGLRLVPPA